MNSLHKPKKSIFFVKTIKKLTEFKNYQQNYKTADKYPCR